MNTQALEANLRADDDTLYTALRQFPDLMGNPRVLEMLNKAAALYSSIYLDHEEALESQYSEGEKDGYNCALDELVDAIDGVFACKNRAENSNFVEDVSEAIADLKSTWEEVKENNK